MVELAQTWKQSLEALHDRIGRHVWRMEPRRCALRYLHGLFSPCAHKNGWHIAEMMGDATPDGLQCLLNAAQWDAHAVRDDLRAYGVEHLGEPDTVLIIDETGFLKQGTKSVGVQRQHSGTAGHVDNCQIGVFLWYASSWGSAFIDRALYVPCAWTRNQEQQTEAHALAPVTRSLVPQLILGTLDVRGSRAEVKVADRLLHHMQWVTLLDHLGAARVAHLVHVERGWPCSFTSPWCSHNFHH